MRSSLNITVNQLVDQTALAFEVFVSAMDAVTTFEDELNLDALEALIIFSTFALAMVAGEAAGGGGGVFID